MSNKQYDFLKYIAVVGLPALATLVATIGYALGFEHTEITVVVITAFNTFLGTLLGISSHNYNKES